MAIQSRRGLKKDFDPYKMLPGEWAVSIDAQTQNQIVWMCFAAGVVKRMATYENFEQDMQEIQAILATCQDIQKAVEAFEKLAADHATLSKSWAVGGTGTRTGENYDNSKYYSEKSQKYSENAEGFLEEVIKIVITDFSVDGDGNLIYYDSNVYNFAVQADGDLYWEVVS